MNEFERIDAFVAQFEPIAAPFGPGDDAAVVDGSCVTTDAVVEGVHFERDTFSLEDIGHKALAVNLSDLAAMGARPRWAVCALGLPKRFSANALRALGRGMASLARVHGVALIGGNVTASPVLSITMTVSGVAKKPMLRSGARRGDAVYLSGPLGLASAGLEVLRHRAKGFDRLAEAQKRPAPHLAWALAAAPFASSGIDVSDGLLQDLGHVAKASRVGFELCSKSIELDAQLLAFAKGSKKRALRYALTGGEDYVLAITVSAGRASAFERAMARHHFAVFKIGCAVGGPPKVVVDGVAPRRAGFQHFG